MSSNDIWNEIQEQLTQLLRDQEFSDFHLFLEKLQQWSSAQPKPYPSDVFEFLLKLIRKMKVEVQQGGSIENVIEQTLKGNYIQPEWDVNNVYQTNGNVFQVIFNAFRELTPKQQKQSTEVPVVLVVMNAIEAQELSSGDIFRDYAAEIGDNFSILKNNLDANSETKKWVGRYNDMPESWQPFDGREGSPSIKESIIQALKLVQESYESISFHPSLKDIRTINKDRRLLKELRGDGCIVIIDVISLCHPKLLKVFQQSLLDAYPNTFVVVIAPAYPIFPLVRQMTMSIQLNVAEMEFAKRRIDQYYEDFGACKEICDEGECQQWLRDRLEKTVKTHKGIQKFINKFLAVNFPVTNTKHAILCQKHIPLFELRGYQYGNDRNHYPR